MNEIQVPKGWELKTIRGIVKKEKFAVVDGPFGTQLHVSDYVQEGIPLIRIKNILWEMKFDSNNLVFITEEKFQELKRSAVYPNDILLAKTGATIGKVSLFPEIFKKALIASSCAKISIDQKLADVRYVLLFLSSNFGQSQINESSKGSTRNSINNDKIRDILIPIPSLPTQKKIVQRLDNVLGKLEKRQKILLGIQTNNFKRIFGKAFDKNPKDHTPNLIKNYSHLLDKLFESEQHISLNSILKEPLRNGKSAVTSNSGKGIPILKLSAVTFKDFGKHNIKLCNLENKNLEDLWIKPNDILIARSNSLEYVGLSVIYEGKDNEFIFPDLMIRVRVNEKMILPKFLAYYLDSSMARKYFQQHAKGSAGTMPKITQSDIENLSIPLFSISKQNKIIKLIGKYEKNSESILHKISSLRIIQNELKQNMTQLNSSILKVAFSGRLVN